MRTRSIRPLLPIVALLTVVPATLASAAPARLAFVTSNFGSGDLSSWPGVAAGLTGVAAGDAACQARAASAGFAHSSAFRAWLSNANDDAFCRVQRLTGKKAANCGQATLPVAAGPWVRPDGEPFAPTIDLLLPPTRQVFYPPAVDETRGNQSGVGDVYTGTLPDGTWDSSLSQCSSWTSASNSDTATGGDVHSASDGWGSGSILNCAGGVRLLCLETGPAVPLPPAQSDGTLAFVTSVTGKGQLSSWTQANGKAGIEAGDAICQQVATDASLTDPTQYKAWLSDSSTDARDRFEGSGPWVRADGTLIARDVFGLIHLDLFTAIDQTEHGDYVGAATVWTGTVSTGVEAPVTCDDWTTGLSVGHGVFGQADRASAQWTAVGASGAACNQTTGHLYCLGGPSSKLFSDGFEIGTSAAWTYTSLF